MNILNSSYKNFKKRNIIIGILAIILLAIIVSIDVIFVLIRNDSNHNALLISSIILTLISLFTFIFIIDVIYLNNTRKLDLYERSINKEKSIIVIKDISTKSTRNLTFNTYKVIYEIDDEIKECYIVENTFKDLQINQIYRVNIYRNILIEANNYEE